MKKGKILFRTAVILMTLLILSMSGCDWLKKILGLEEHTLMKVLVTADKTTMIMSESVQLGSQGIYADSDEATYIYDLTWSSSDDSIVSVDVSSGTPSAKAHNILGTVTITGEKDGVQGNLELTVVMPDFMEIYISPEGYGSHTNLVPFGYTYQFTAMGAIENYADVDITRYITGWASDDELVGTISNTGLMTTTGRGSTDITAALDELTSRVCQMDVQWAIDVVLNLPAAAEGSSVLLSGFYGSTGNLDGMFPDGAVFSSGVLPARLVKPETGFYDTPPTTTTVLVNDGTFRLYVITDADNDGTITTADSGVFRTVTKTGSVHAPENIPAAEFAGLVNESVVITSSSVPDGAFLYGCWRVQGAGLIDESIVLDNYNYLEPGGSAGSAPAVGLRSWCAGTFANGDGSLTAGSNIPLVPGVYSLNIAIDADANGTIGDFGSGDYSFLVPDITVAGSGTNIDAALAGAASY